MEVLSECVDMNASMKCFKTIQPYNSLRSLPKSLKLLMKTEKVVQQAHELAPVLAGEVLSLCTYTDLVLE